jgi:predicted nucleic acid-binding protein
MDPETAAAESAIPQMPMRLAMRVRTRHLVATARPIVGADEAGCFITPGIPALPPLVADANVLNRDVIRAARTGQRTVLLNAANSGLLRLFVADHVLAEVPEHAERMAKRAKVSTGAYLACWEKQYLPLLRLVEVGEGLLGLAEQARVDLLAAGPAEMCDPDDVPTAVLALQLGAVVLSTDRKVLHAVYGLQADLTRHDQWLQLLQLGGDAGALGQINDEEGRTLEHVGGLAFAGLGALWQTISPWAAVLVVGLGWYGWRRASPQVRKRLADAAIEVLTEEAMVVAWMKRTTDSFRAAAALPPRWEELAAEVPARAVLERACLHTLARSAQSDRSAREVAERLPALPVAQGEAKVRAVLREHGAFHQPYRGRFQVGRPGLGSAL